MTPLFPCATFFKIARLISFQHVPPPPPHPPSPYAREFFATVFVPSNHFPRAPHAPSPPIPPPLSGHVACISNQKFAGTLGKERACHRCRLTYLAVYAAPRVTQSSLSDKNVMDILVFKGRVELQVSDSPPIIRHSSSSIIRPIRKLFNTSKRARTCSTTSRLTSRHNLKCLHLPPLHPMTCFLCCAVVCEGCLPVMCGNGARVVL